MISILLGCGRRAELASPEKSRLPDPAGTLCPKLRVNGRQLFQNPGDSGIGFDSDPIIDRRPNPLLAAKVSLGCLNRDMSQEELDLLQFAS
jgi:hypothetical protein